MRIFHTFDRILRSPNVSSPGAEFLCKCSYITFIAVNQVDYLGVREYLCRQDLRRIVIREVGRS
jgi:hypothetical protein